MARWHDRLQAGYGKLWIFESEADRRNLKSNFSSYWKWRLRLCAWMSSRWGSCRLKRCDKLFPHSLFLPLCQCSNSQRFTQIRSSVHAFIPLYPTQFGFDVALSGRVRREIQSVIVKIAEPCKSTSWKTSWPSRRNYEEWKWHILYTLAAPPSAVSQVVWLLIDWKLTFSKVSSIREFVRRIGVHVTDLW